MEREEEIKLEFFKQFGNESFRGYPLEQCHSIWEFFEKYIQCQEDMADKIKEAYEQGLEYGYACMPSTINPLNKQD